MARRAQHPAVNTVTHRRIQDFVRGGGQGPLGPWGGGGGGARPSWPPPPWIRALLFGGAIFCGGGGARGPGSAHGYCSVRVLVSTVS